MHRLAAFRSRSAVSSKRRLAVAGATTAITLGAVHFSQARAEPVPTPSQRIEEIWKYEVARSGNKYPDWPEYKFAKIYPPNRDTRTRDALAPDRSGRNKVWTKTKLWWQGVTLGVEGVPLELVGYRPIYHYAPDRSVINSFITRFCRDVTVAYLFGCTIGFLWHGGVGARYAIRGERWKEARKKYKVEGKRMALNFCLWLTFFSGFRRLFSFIRDQNDAFNTIMAGGMSGFLAAGADKQQVSMRTRVNHGMQGLLLLFIIELLIHGIGKVLTAGHVAKKPFLGTGPNGISGTILRAESASPEVALYRLAPVAKPVYSLRDIDMPLFPHTRRRPIPPLEVVQHLESQRVNAELAKGKRTKPVDDESKPAF